MQQEPSQELLGGNCHQPLLVLMGIIFPAEGDLAIGNVYDPVVGDGDAMRVAGQIVEDMFGSSEWPLGVDYPVVTKQWPEKSTEGVLLDKLFHTAREPEFPLVKSALQTGNKLAAKHAAQHLHRQEEGITGVDPALVIGRQTAGWDHAVNMRMSLKLLSPGVKHTQETNLGSKMLGVGGNLHESRSAGVEQQVINDLLVLQSQPRQFVWNREHHVHVLQGQQFLAAFDEPLIASVGLAFWTMPGTARVKRGTS